MLVKNQEWVGRELEIGWQGTRNRLVRNVASIANGATGRQDRNLVSSISTWVASNFNSSSRTIITIYESVLEDVQSLKCSTNHVLNLYVRHTSQPCTAFTMCTLIDPLYLLEGLFLSLVRFLSIILDSHQLITLSSCTASQACCTLLDPLVSGILPSYHS